MKRTGTVVLAGLLIAGATWAGEVAVDHGKKAAEVTVVAQTICPVMGGKINKDLFVDQDGKRIYVCCQGCIAAVQKEFQTYAKKLEEQGVTVAKLQETCPVMGGKINKDLFVDQDGKRIYVCCQGCIAAVKKDFQTYVKKLAEKGEVPVLVPEKPAND